MSDPLLASAPRIPARLLEVKHADGSHAGFSRVIDCPYCGLAHTHGTSLGHRNSHCADYAPPRSRKTDPRDTRNNPGYVLCDPADNVNWDAEALKARLVVLRNQYGRLLAEHDAMVPLGAREERVKAGRKAQADSIAEIFEKAGVSL